MEELVIGDYAALAAHCEDVELKVFRVLDQVPLGTGQCVFQDVVVINVNMSSILNILQAPNGIADPQIYGCLLAAYLLLNEMYVVSMCIPTFC